MSSIKVLVVDDSAFMRKLISDFLKEDPRFDVVATARNGKDAIAKVKQFQPDVVTLDIEMPEMNGIEALKIIMSEMPTRIVMLSSTTQEGAENTVLAIQYGAVDFIAKPSGAISLDLHKVKDEMLSKILMASRANIRALNTPKLTMTNNLEEIEKEKVDIPKPAIKRMVSKVTGSHPQKLLCIGTSTGGPRALQKVLTKLPKTISAPILIVQHMPAGFTKSLAVRLDSLSEINVKEAEEGDILQKGTAYIAPGGYHLKIKSVNGNLVVHLEKSEPRNGHRPSVDVLFESVSTIQGYDKVAVIMTGMGSDGANGLKELKATGSTIAIAESEESSIVFGMPKSAIATNLVDEVAHLDRISSTILKYIEA